MKLISQFVLENPKLSIGFILILLLTGGGMMGKSAYMSSAQFYGLVNSLILQIDDIVGVYKQ